MRPRDWRGAGGLGVGKEGQGGGGVGLGEKGFPVRGWGLWVEWWWGGGAWGWVGGGSGKCRSALVLQVGTVTPRSPLTTGHLTPSPPTIYHLSHTLATPQITTTLNRLLTGRTQIPATLSSLLFPGGTIYEPKIAAIQEQFLFAQFLVFNF